MRLVRNVAVAALFSARFSWAQASGLDTGIAVPLTYYARLITSAGERERSGGRTRGVRINVRGLPAADSSQVWQALDAAFGARVPIDSAPRVLSYTLIFQWVTADSTVVQFHQNSFTRCDNGWGTSHGIVTTQLFRREPQGWQPSVQTGKGVAGTSLPCNAPRPPV